MASDLWHYLRLRPTDLKRVHGWKAILPMLSPGNDPLTLAVYEAIENLAWVDTSFDLCLTGSS